ncbi:conserved hypothetical protein [Uncinocarpus reesii 1704]|uniref:Mitochondrial thiamine pyrophosphate carrier 1 n=1 Tax=Uncinocarpus reesii (strain UAMH 1704) TaxID=336963 RepID=C4JPI3_UNCRE|nr:uncharacterized protein UREG_03155 [Uncinocarpus reesii 1704]EEP78309.1 conserved hypothetical protein [Uncinocarpus reesii 1704]
MVQFSEETKATPIVNQDRISSRSIIGSHSATAKEVPTIHLKLSLLLYSLASGKLGNIHVYRVTLFESSVKSPGAREGFPHSIAASHRMLSGTLNLKDALRRLYGREDGLGNLDYFVASGTAANNAYLKGALTAILTNPIWVIKTRMLSTGAGVAGAYPSMTHGIRQIYQSEGLTGFYRGMIPALLGVGHGALQFMAYEQLKRYRSLMVSSDLTASDSGAGKLSNTDYLALSGLSKVFAGSVTYPYQVLRARLQTYDAAGTYRGFIDVISQIWRREGLTGFYKGLGPNLFRVLPSTWVTFLVYENMREYCLHL